MEPQARRGNPSMFSLTPHSAVLDRMAHDFKLMVNATSIKNKNQETYSKVKYESRRNFPDLKIEQILNAS